MKKVRCPACYGELIREDGVFQCTTEGCFLAGAAIRKEAVRPEAEQFVDAPYPYQEPLNCGDQHELDLFHHLEQFQGDGELLFSRDQK